LQSYGSGLGTGLRFLIFLTNFLPLALTAVNAVHNVDETHLTADENLG